MTSIQLKKIVSAILVGFVIIFGLSLFALGVIGVLYYIFDIEPSKTILITTLVGVLVGLGGFMFIGMIDLLFRALHIPDDEPINTKSVCTIVIVSLLIVGGIFYSICS